MRRRPSWRATRAASSSARALALALAAALALAGSPEASGLAEAARPPSTPGAACQDPPAPPDLPRARIASVVDGDTVRIRAGVRSERVRLIGIDAPETRYVPRMERQARAWDRPRDSVRALGEEAKAFAEARLDAREVRLESDVEMHDRYGRRLAYIWLADDVLFNRLIVAEGYAAAARYPPNLRYAGRFSACEAVARAAGRGLWRGR